MEPTVIVQMLPSSGRDLSVRRAVAEQMRFDQLRSQALGLWGIFIGPVVACCLHALVKIFNTELGEFSKERFAKTTPAVGSEHAPPAAPVVVAPPPATLAQG